MGLGSLGSCEEHGETGGALCVLQHKLLCEEQLHRLRQHGALSTAAEPRNAGRCYPAYIPAVCHVLLLEECSQLLQAGGVSALRAV